MDFIFQVWILQDYLMLTRLIFFKLLESMVSGLFSLGIWPIIVDKLMLILQSYKEDDFNFCSVWEQSNMGMGWFIYFHRQYEKRSWCCLPSSEKNNIHFTKSTHVSNSVQVWCTPLQCWRACRSHKWRSGLYVDIELRTSVSFCTRVLILNVII